MSTKPSNREPTAHTSVGDTAATPFRGPIVGSGEALQLLPSQCTAHLIPPLSPLRTAHTSLAEMAATPVMPWNAVVDMAQLLPSQCKIPPEPTAHRSSAATPSTPYSTPALG